MLVAMFWQNTAIDSDNATVLDICPLPIFNENKNVSLVTGLTHDFEHV